VAEPAWPGARCSGEAKWNETIGTSHLERLRRIRALLTGRVAMSVDGCRLVLFSGAGCTAELQAEAAADPVIQLVGPERLYG
jgi:hypothetical protein